MRFYIYTILGLLAFTLLIGLAGNGDLENERQQRETYCDMIALYDETNGDAGWPPYDGECDNG